MEFGVQDLERRFLLLGCRVQDLEPMLWVRVWGPGSKVQVWVQGADSRLGSFCGPLGVRVYIRVLV